MIGVKVNEERRLINATIGRRAQVTVGMIMGTVVSTANGGARGNLFARH